MNAFVVILLALFGFAAAYLSHVTFTPLLSVAFVAFILLFWFVVVAWHITEGN
jgi:hypothetical protein